MNITVKHKRLTSLLILVMIWLLGAVCDRVWFALDRSVPSWDQADYLTGTLNYWRALQNPQWLNGDWWHNLWLLSSKIPPFTYIVTGALQHVIGTGSAQATLIMLFFNAILLASVYGLGVQLFSVEVGLWAAAICQVLPALYRLRLEFLLDFPLAAMVTLSFFCLTAWRNSYLTTEMQRTQRGREDKVREKAEGELIITHAHWLWTLAFGLSLGCALLTKQPALFFLFTPIVWVAVGALRRRYWGRLVQLVAALCLSVLVFGPWYRTNWLTVLTSGKRATIDSAIAEGDPGLNTLQAWTFYAQQLPHQLSLPLLIVPIGMLLLWWGRSKFPRDGETPKGGETSWGGETPRGGETPPLRWLAVFWLGGYLFSTLNINKDDRYVLPYLPVVALFLAYGLTQWRSLWAQRVRICTVGLAALLMVLNLFPIGGVVGDRVTNILSPFSQIRPDRGVEFPHREVIAEIIQTEPYLRSTLGVLPSTGQVNQHNLNYYGALQNFQVYGRQVGVRKKFVPQDARSLSWFVTKTGDQGSVRESQADIVKLVEQGGDFQLNKAWSLPDGSTLNLYHQKLPPAEVKPVSQASAKVTLSQVTVPATAPPGIPVPVTYEWTGDWKDLQSGLVLLTWRNSPENLTPQPPSLVGKEESLSPLLAREGLGVRSKSLWLHDHGFAMGNLQDSGLRKGGGTPPLQIVQLTERMAMLPPGDTIAGNYTLEATYLNRVTGETYPIPVPPVTLQIAANATPTPAPELDLVTQLRVLAANLPKGPEALESLFDEVGRINQYDPTQDYLIQAQQTLAYRLKQSPNKDLAYNLALSHVLKRQVNGAIAALKQVIELDPKNPYAYAYLAFVQLYNWQPAAAQKSLQPSLALNPNSREIQALNGVAALMQGNLIKAWQSLSILRR
ncbi:MAG: phospholipid carrier-dependent glycosyltransferase [Nostocaceae cyanobacterium]|nr:phospholipid carrier-dependent glycosyltransferase [Nostocaceae cyanobacterium]